MTDSHSHSHSHGGHTHSHAHDGDHTHDELFAAAYDTDIPEHELSPADVSRRGLLRAAGITGALTAGIAGMSGVTPAMAEQAAAGRTSRKRENGIDLWLAGDHHIHTQYSSDGQYTVLNQAEHAKAYGLDWMVVTDHGSATHARVGVDLVHPDILDARRKLPGIKVFQGFEWNIPAAEHGTIFVAPGRNELAVLKQFENRYDGVVNNATASTAANEALAVAGIQWLGGQVSSKRVDEALFLANHPARNGLDSPHEIRAWRDADPSVAIGFEGAPGHQAAGLPAGYGAGSARGFYGNAPGANSFAGFPPESYRTWGGFDWMTSTVGGLWDSLIAEGKPWSITANSDSHTVFADTSMRPDGSTNDSFVANGRYDDPVYSGKLATTNGDFWPGFYSRTHVGVEERDYVAIMQGMRDGRIWVDHGGLVKVVNVSVTTSGRGSTTTETLGGTIAARRGSKVSLVVKIATQDLPNWSQFVPSLNRVDLIRGKVDPTSAKDRDVFKAPQTSVVKQWDTSKREGVFALKYDLGTLEEGFYIRLRGTDGKRQQPGFYGAAVDPAGPAIDVVGSADPWQDLWFYTNPIWVIPTS